MAHGHHRTARRQPGQRLSRNGLILGYTVEPEDVELLAQQHTAFDPRPDHHVRDEENDEGGWLDSGLQRWHDRDFMA